MNAVVPLRNRAPLAAKPGDSAELKLQFFGGFQIVLNGKPVGHTLKYRKGIALLAYLVIERGRSHSRDKLADMFWPNLSATAARSNLRQVLCNLSQCFSANEDNGCGLNVNSSSVVFEIGPNINLDIDSDQFNQWIGVRKEKGLSSKIDERELALLPKAGSLGGELLEGLSLPECEEFEEWLACQRQKFQSHHQGLLGDLSDCIEISGSYPLALTFAERLQELDPLLDSYQLRVMRLFEKLGYEDEAMRSFETFRQRLREELNVAPSAPLLSLVQQLKEKQIAVLESQSTLDRANGGSVVEKTEINTVLYCRCEILSSDTDKKCVQAAKKRYDEFTQAAIASGAKSIRWWGGGIVAYFGADQWTKSDAQSALNAANALLKKANGDMLCIGIHTGNVVACTYTQSPDLLGQVTEIAGRIALAAEPGEVAICEASKVALGLEGKAEILNTWQFRGIANEVTVYRIK